LKAMPSTDWVLCLVYSPRLAVQDDKGQRMCFYGGLFL
jgi:hypothetical protein